MAAKVYLAARVSVYYFHFSIHPREQRHPQSVNEWGISPRITPPVPVRSAIAAEAEALVFCQNLFPLSKNVSLLLK